MRACPQCSLLIHDAAVVCRFCNESVTGHFAVAPGWKNFASRFFQASKREQRDLWRDLGAEDRSYAQRALGLESPERFEFTSERLEEDDPAPRPVVDPSGFQLRRLLTGYALLFTLSVALVAGVLLLRIVETPSLAFQSLILSVETISQNLHPSGMIASKKRAVFARDAGHSTVVSAPSNAPQLQQMPAPVTGFRLFPNTPLPLP